MYHISSGWLLHDIPFSLLEESRRITLRGYHEELVRLSDFAWGVPLSVDDIVSDVCPVRKDLYNDKARGLKGTQKNGRMTWGRLTGMIVEPYCTGLLGKFDDLYTTGRKITYQSLINDVNTYSEEFFSQESIHRKLRELTKTAADEGLYPARHIQLILQYSARNELAFLGADWVLGGGPNGAVPKLTERVPIVVDKAALKIHPKSDLIGISDPATPDFLLKGVSLVGDVKSGVGFKHTYQLTCAGYALARESELGPAGDTNFGIVYFIETHSPVPAPARAYFFVISDALRRAFIDRRDDAFNVLSQSILTKQPPDITPVKRKVHCIHCKFLDVCDSDRLAQGIPLD